MVAHSNQRTSFPILVGQNKNSPTIRSLPTSGFGFIFQRILISHGCIDCGESLFQELIGVFWRKVSLSISWICTVSLFLLFSRLTSVTNPATTSLSIAPLKLWYALRCAPSTISRMVGVFPPFSLLNRKMYA